MAEIINHNSSFIAATEYYNYPEDEREADDLVVEFTDGTRYVYDGVSHGLYTSFIVAPSRGKAFHQLIKPMGGEEI